MTAAEKEKQRALKVYIHEKIEMLEHEFYIRLSHQEYRHLLECKTENDVDRYARTLLKEKL